MPFIKRLIIILLMLYLVNFEQVFAQDDNFTFDFDINSADYSSEQGILNFETKTQVGVINANNFEFDSDLFSFYISDKDGVDIFISADPKKVHFESAQVGYKHKIDAFKALEKIKFFSAKDFQSRLDEESFFLDQDHLIYETFTGNEFVFNNFTVKCLFMEDLPFEVLSDRLLYNCLNQSSLVPSKAELNSPKIRISGADYDFETYVNEFQIEKNNLRGDGTSLKFMKEGEKLKTIVDIEHFNLKCEKPLITTNNFIEIITNGCYETMDYSSNELSFIIDEIEKSEQTEVNLKKGVIKTNVEKISLRGEQIEINDDKAETKIDNVTASCQKSSKEKEIKEKALKSCLNESDITASKLQHHDKESLSRTTVTSLKASLEKNNRFKFIANDISIVDKKKARINIKGANVLCTRSASTKEKFEVGDLFKGCFGTSVVKVDAIKYHDPKSDANLNISYISLANNKIVAYAPTATYDLDNSRYAVTGARFSCSLSKKFDVIKEGDWRKVLSNCMRDMRIDIATSIDEKLDVGPFKMHKYRDIEIIVKNNKLTMNLKVKNKIKVTAKVKVEGSVYFENNDTRMVFDIPDKKIKVLGFVPIPSKKIFKDVIRSFVKDERVTAYGNKVKIDLSEQ